MRKNKLIVAALLTAVSGAVFVSTSEAETLPLRLCNQDKFQNYPLMIEDKGCLPEIPLTTTPEGGTYTS